VLTDRALARLLAAELVGTFALVFAGCGAIMVDAKTHALGTSASRSRSGS
jgi:glycerol uptake facilitator-like aquaporin